MPYKVTNKDSDILILITARTDNYSYSVLVTLRLSGECHGGMVFYIIMFFT